MASALLADAEYKPVSDLDFINALTLGVEVECRIGNCVYPEQYDVGWHITSTAKTSEMGDAIAVAILQSAD
ncbi:MAG: MmgE/PrpD family protein [Acidocella sp.]|nr:MmgE/PrpD family protein [Acidocella sp.]